MTEEKPSTSAPAKASLGSRALKQLRLAFILIAISAVVDWGLGERKDGPGLYLGELSDGIRAGTPQLQPIGVATKFFSRLAHSEYGWKLLSWRAPFNLTAARIRLRYAHPELKFNDNDPFNRAQAWPPLGSLGIGGTPHPDYDAWAEEYASIERGRFPLVNSANDPLSFQEEHPNTASLRTLCTLASKLVGLPDAFIHIVILVRHMPGLAEAVAILTFVFTAPIVFNPGFKLGFPFRLLLWPVAASFFALILQGAGVLAAFLLPGIVPHPFFVASIGTTHCFLCFSLAAIHKLTEHHVVKRVEHLV